MIEKEREREGWTERGGERRRRGILTICQRDAWDLLKRGCSTNAFSVHWCERQLGLLSYAQVPCRFHSSVGWNVWSWGTCDGAERGGGNTESCDSLMPLSTGHTPLVLTKEDQSCSICITVQWRSADGKRHRTVMPKAHKSRPPSLASPPSKVSRYGHVEIGQDTTKHTRSEQGELQLLITANFGPPTPP